MSHNPSNSSLAAFKFKPYYLLLLAFLLAPSELYGAYGPYDATLIRVIDGDTIKANVEIWPGLTVETSVRVAGVNAPELRRADECEKIAGQHARDYAAAWFARHSDIQITNVQQDKYAGRVLARVISGGSDFGADLIAAGHAVPYSGGKRASWCENKEGRK